jgi:hypothetical protein
MMVYMHRRLLTSDKLKLFGRVGEPTDPQEKMSLFNKCVILCSKSLQVLLIVYTFTILVPFVARQWRSELWHAIISPHKQ